MVAAVGVILAALYLLWAYQRVFHGEPKEADLDTPEMRLGEFGLLAPFLAGMVFLGVYPGPLLDRIEPSVDRLISHVESHSDYVRPADDFIVVEHEEGGEEGGTEDHPEGEEDDG